MPVHGYSGELSARPGVALTLVYAAAMLFPIMIGIIYLIGIGPGEAAHITPEARAVIKKAQTLIGQKASFRSIRRLVQGKEIIAKNMSPPARSRLAIARAQSGCCVAIISSGHPGIFAIASTFFEYLKNNDIDIPVKVIPGLTLADYAAARLGSPLGHDFAVLSLADQATDWAETKQRLMSALAADFVIVLYNPIGKIGAERIREAFNLALDCRAPGTPVGLVTDAASKKEQLGITDIIHVNPDMITLNTLVIIGNSRSYIYAGKLITPRPYEPGIGY
jgi:precorrin-3B C17-methyltransferase